MISYITQLNIIRADNRVLLGELVEAYSIDKCVKKVEYYIRDTKIDGIAKHEAFIYFTTPEPPISSVELGANMLGVLVTVTVESPIVVNLYEVGIVYSLLSNPTVLDTKVLFPTVYGTNTVLIPYISIDVTKEHYIRPYTISCVGTNYGEAQKRMLLGIGYDIIEETLIVY